MKVSTQLLPAINHIISKAEDDLRRLIGTPLMLRMELMPSGVNEVFIQSLVCESFNVSWNQIIGTSRETNIKNARFVYVWLSIMWLHKTLESIGAELNRDHSTIINARDRMKGWLTTGDTLITSKINSIEAKLRTI